MKDSDSSAEGKFKRYICMTCGFIYDEATGDPLSGIEPGTRFEDLPEEWVCSMCGDPKSEFRLLTDEEAAASTPADSGVQGDTKQIIVIGSGIAGWAAIEELRKSGHQGSITLVTQGRADYYYKPALSASSSKGLSSKDLVVHTAAGKSTELGVTLVENTRVIGIEKAKKKIITDNGLFAYDRLIVATGSNARIPALFRVNNVYSINSLNDYEKLHSKLPEVKHLAIIGGGLIGCEMADDLSRAGVKLTVINQARNLLEGLVPEPLAQGLQNALASKGVVIRNNEEITELNEKDGGTLQLRLASGDSLQVEALLLCTGTVASYRFCQLAGIESGAHGIVVDSHMRTSDPSIYALGDCMECEGQSLKFVEPIINQAKVIAHHMTSDDVSIQYQPERILIKVKTPSYPICVYKHRLSTPVKTWKLINSDEDGIFAELFCDNNNIGCALSGKYVKEMQTDLKTSYIKKNN